jgi:endoglucanase
MLTSYISKPRPLDRNSRSRSVVALAAACFAAIVVSPELMAVEQTASTEKESLVAAPVRLNSIGYLVNANKVAVFAIGREGDTFLVRDVATGREVHRGQLSALAKSDDTPAILNSADFSAVQAPGRYQLQLLDGPSSPTFEISNDVYNWPFYCAMRAMYLCRCGTAVESEFAGQKFGHAACHMDDGYLDYAGGPVGAHRDGSGGWHDAGDYNKYTVNSAFTVGMLLRAWEDHTDRLASVKLRISRNDSGVPDYLNEIRWELDWLLKMQADDGSVYHKLSALKYCGYIMPEAEHTRRYFSPWGSAATADFVAVTAQAARVYQPYDSQFSDRCLAASEKGHEFLKLHPESHRPDLKAFSMDGYQHDDAEARLWATTELWETTGKSKYLADFERRLSISLGEMRDAKFSVKDAWDWPDVRNLAAFTYVASKRSGRAKNLVDLANRAVLASAARIENAAGRDSYQRPLGSTYYWGCNGTVARQTMILNSAIGVGAAEQRPSEGQAVNGSSYRATMLDGLNYLFGKNPYGRSFVTGVGHNPPQNPHDRRSIADGVKQPWPGYLVGGPWPKATDWHDDEDDYKTNEVAINWNGALIYALASFVEPTTFDACIAKAEHASQNTANPRDKASGAPAGN